MSLISVLKIQIIDRCNHYNIIETSRKY